MCARLLDNKDIAMCFESVYTDKAAVLNIAAALLYGVEMRFERFG